MAKYTKDEIIHVPRFKESEGFYTSPQRSYTMSRIKGKNTAPERAFRKALWAKGVRYRVNYKRLPGKPDLSSKKYKFAVFIDGGFWHGKDWSEKKKKIKSNRAFWIPKIERNMQRDRTNNRLLENMGYTVFRFWDDEVKKNLPDCVGQVVRYIRQIK